MLTQPKPLRTCVETRDEGNGPVSTISRVWNQSETGNCTLCPDCRAIGIGNERSLCMVCVPGHVGPIQARMYRFDPARGDSVRAPLMVDES